MEVLMYRKIVLWVLVIGFVSLLCPLMLDACPNCKNLDEPIARGFNWSILFMMAMPFTVFGVIGGSIFYHFQRANRNLST